MGQRIAGTCYFKIDGEQLELEGGIELPLFKTKRESVESISGPTGYFKESDVVPFIKGSFLVPSTFPLSTLESGTEMTITAELANGMVYTLSGAFIVGDAALKGDEGKVDLEFNGKKGDFQ
jgi:hypothetical protein